MATTSSIFALLSCSLSTMASVLKKIIEKLPFQHLYPLLKCWALGLLHVEEKPRRQQILMIGSCKKSISDRHIIYRGLTLTAYNKKHLKWETTIFLDKLEKAPPKMFITLETDSASHLMISHLYYLGISSLHVIPLQGVLDAFRHIFVQNDL